jgi:hypothetical protein
MIFVLKYKLNPPPPPFPPPSPPSKALSCLQKEIQSWRSYTYRYIQQARTTCRMSTSNRSPAMPVEALVLPCVPPPHAIPANCINRSSNIIHYTYTPGFLSLFSLALIQATSSLSSWRFISSSHPPHPLTCPDLYWVDNDIIWQFNSGHTHWSCWMWCTSIMFLKWDVRQDYLRYTQLRSYSC